MQYSCTIVCVLLISCHIRYNINVKLYDLYVHFKHSILCCGQQKINQVKLIRTIISIQKYVLC